MKTLLFTIEFPPFKGGVAKYYENLVEFWPQKDNIFVLHNLEGKLLSKVLFPRWLPALYHLYKAIKKNKIDHVIVGHILPLGTVTFLLSRIMKIEYSVMIHGMDIEFAQKKKRKQFLAGIVLGGAKKIICNSRNTKEILSRSFDGDMKKVKIVNPGITPIIKFDKKKVIDLKKKYKTDGKFVLLSVSRLVKRKGHDLVVAALNLNKSKSKDIIYLIAGAGPDENYLKEKAKDVSNVHFLGRVSDETKWALMHLCDVFVMPVRETDGDVEGFGIVYLEAGLMKKPVIAGRSGGTADAVIDYETGILCDPESPEDIFGAITELKKSWPLRNALGEKGMRRTGDDFSAEKQSQKIFTFIN